MAYLFVQNLLPPIDTSDMSFCSRSCFFFFFQSACGSPGKKVSASFYHNPYAI